MLKSLLLAPFILCMSLAPIYFATAEETKIEKAETMGNKAADAVKRTYRNAKGEICEVIEGKVNCLAQEVIDKTKNAADSIETKGKETKKKLD